jgi:hypothetical protein
MVGFTFIASTGRWEAGVRSFIITFDIYVILNTFEKYDNKRPDPICLFCENVTSSSLDYALRSGGIIEALVDTVNKWDYPGGPHGH